MLPSSPNAINRIHVILFLISKCYGHQKFASFGSSEDTELSYIKINEKMGAHGISCDCWSDSGTPPDCDLILPNPHNFLRFFTKDKEGFTRPNTLNLPCHSIALGES